jgi:hypothetical protein
VSAASSEIVSRSALPFRGRETTSIVSADIVRIVRGR